MAVTKGDTKDQLLSAVTISTTQTPGNREVIRYRREPSISNLPIQVGDIQFDNNVTVQIKIYDIYYDYEVVEKHFTIEAPQIYVPVNGEDVTKALLLITTFNDKIGPMTAGGDNVRTFRYIASIASMIHKYPNKMNTTTPEDIIGGSVDHVTLYEESDVEILYENFLINITNIMVEDVKNVSDLSYKIYSLSEISSILSGIDAVVRHTIYIKFNSLRNILRVFLDISQCFVSRVKHTELPLRNHDVSTLNEIVNHFVRILNNLIEVLIPKQWIDFDEELSFLSVLSELVHIFGTHIDTNLIVQERTDGISHRLREKAELLFELRTYEREIATIQREIMSEYFQRIQDTIMDVQLLTLETIVTGEKLEFQKPLIKLITDKTTYGDFRETYINNNMKNSYILGLSNLNNTFSNPNTLLNVMVRAWF
ncbi:uncharacterized protein LOC134246032 [Saccostrea cucullata]|uniref:uncharacterized protein LOC134246032 n=1 Tax=Saccostrea cuccullata TaxID=36930 RepID=UPI002ED66FCF